MAFIPPPDSYIRYYDWTTNRWRYTYLVEAEGPMHYPQRFPALSPGSQQSQPTIISEPIPSSTKPHLYLALLGLWPGFRYAIYHPYNVQQLRFDERIQLIDPLLTAYLEYADSPHEDPQFPLWITNKRYPGIQPMNIMFKAGRPQVRLDIIRYRAIWDESSDRAETVIDPAVLVALREGRIPSVPVRLGGEFT